MRALGYSPATSALLATACPIATAQTHGLDPSTRMVLVELDTSQGCDLCPVAEEMLGALAARDYRIVPIAFHVDYLIGAYRNAIAPERGSWMDGQWPRWHNRER